MDIVYKLIRVIFKYVLVFFDYSYNIIEVEKLKELISYKLGLILN